MHYVAMMNASEMGKKGAAARWAAMTQEERTEFMREVGKKGAAVRWAKYRAAKRRAAKTT